MSGHILEVEALTVTYRGRNGPVEAVADLEFRLKSGSTLGIIGESGAGKTSIGLALAGLLDRKYADVSGSARFRGRELLDLPEKEMAGVRGSGIGMLFQDPVASLDPTMRVADQVAESISLRGIARGEEARLRAFKELADVGIDEPTLVAAPYAHQLSGGQCQRVQIAAALAGSPDLLIADEPTSSLDMTRQKQVIELLMARLRREDMAMIFISHDLLLVAGIAEQLLVMREGRAVESGPCVRVLSQPADSYTAELIEAGIVGSREGNADGSA